MPDEIAGVVAEAPASQNANVPQDQVNPEDRIATIEANFAKLEGLTKEVQGLRSTNGWLRHQVKIATEKSPDFEAAFAGYEESKAILLVHGWSEDDISEMATKTPMIMKKIAKNLADASSDNSAIKTLRDDIVAVKGQSPAAEPRREEVMTGRLAGAPRSMTWEQAQRIKNVSDLSDADFQRIVASGKK